MELVKFKGSNLKIDDRIESLTKEFLLSQDVSISSRLLYGRTLKQYFNYLKDTDIPMSDVTRKEIIGYKENLLAKGFSPLTVGSYLTVVRKFYEWTESNKYYPNVAKGIKTPKRRQEFRKLPLSINQVNELLAHLESHCLRDFAIINLLLRTGLRTVEVIRANIEDITLKEGKRILMVHGKGEVEKNRFVILTDKAHLPLAKYLETRGNPKGGEPLFTSTSNNSKGKRMTTRSISFIAKRYLKEIGIDDKHYTAHSLRHTTAVNILRGGGTLGDVQGVLRHSDPKTSQIYTRSIEDEMRIKNAPEELLDNLF